MINPDVDRMLQTLRLIVVALAMGVIGLGAVAVFLVASGTMDTNPESANILLIALAGFAAAEIPAYALLRTAIMGNLRRTWDGRASDEVPKEELAKGFNLLTIIGGALAEGLSLFGLVILLVSGNWLAVAAPVIGLLLLAAQLPTRDRFNRFAGNVTGQHWM